jgi:hypothetical protein
MITWSGDANLPALRRRFQKLFNALRDPGATLRALARRKLLLEKTAGYGLLLMVASARYDGRSGPRNQALQAAGAEWFNADWDGYTCDLMLDKLTFSLTGMQRDDRELWDDELWDVMSFPSVATRGKERAPARRRRTLPAGLVAFEAVLTWPPDPHQRPGQRAPQLQRREEES